MCTYLYLDEFRSRGSLFSSSPYPFRWLCCAPTSFKVYSRVLGRRALAPLHTDWKPARGLLPEDSLTNTSWSGRRTASAHHPERQAPGGENPEPRPLMILSACTRRLQGWPRPMSSDGDGHSVNMGETRPYILLPSTGLARHTVVEASSQHSVLILACSICFSGSVRGRGARPDPGPRRLGGADGLPRCEP